MGTAPPGQHNAVLCRAAYALGQLIGAELLDYATARAELTAAASGLIGADCDCTPAEVMVGSRTAGPGYQDRAAGAPSRWIR